MLVADLLDGSLAVINPDSPSATFAIHVVAAVAGVNNCEVGPLYVAATSTNLAFVVTGSLSAPSCPQYGGMYAVNLQTHTAGPGTQITVRGSGFNSTVTAKVGGVAATVNVTDENTLTLTIPTANSGPEDIVLSRGEARPTH